MSLELRTKAIKEMHDKASELLSVIQDADGRIKIQNENIKGLDSFEPYISKMVRDKMEAEIEITKAARIRLWERYDNQLAEIFNYVNNK